jgi:hypothetical protein
MRTSESGTILQCALCGARFTDGVLACGTCPLRRACDVACCPNCGYQFPRSSRLAAWLRWLWGRKEDS